MRHRSTTRPVAAPQPGDDGQPGRQHHRAEALIALHALVRRRMSASGNTTFTAGAQHTRCEPRHHLAGEALVAARWWRGRRSPRPATRWMGLEHDCDSDPKLLRAYVKRGQQRVEAASDALEEAQR